MLSVIGFVKTDVITHCWQCCALSRDSKRNHPLHTHAHGHTCWGHWCIVWILPWLLWAWQGREDPWFMGIQRPACLGADNCPSCQNCTPYIKLTLFSLMAPNTPCWEYRITTCVKLQWCYLAWSNSSALRWVPGERTHFPLHQLYGQLCLWKQRIPTSDGLTEREKEATASANAHLFQITFHLPPFFWKSRQKVCFFN